MINATGDWTALPGLVAPCGPDGLAASCCLLTASFCQTRLPRRQFRGPKAEGAFVIGSGCVVPVLAGSIGPLFVSFNITARPVWVTTIAIDITGAAPSLWPARQIVVIAECQKILVYCCEIREFRSGNRHAMELLWLSIHAA
jgi:hypothetical protein